MPEKIPLQVFVISDATGRTAEAVFKAVLVQFPEIEPDVIRFQNIRTRQKASEVLERAEAVSGIVIYSFVSEPLRQHIRKEGRRRNLLLFDLLGPLIEKVHRVFNLIPISTPGLLTHVHEESFRVAEAIDFTLNHDDGRELETFDQADLILLGVSRTSKTPTSIYLACNYVVKVANLPILPGLDPPKSVHRLDVPKVGLTISPERLALIRKRRIKHLPDYTNLDQIYREIEHSEEWFRRLPPLYVINIDDLSIEEVASRIVRAGILRH